MKLKINITYGIDFEKERVEKTIAKLQWYTENGYRPRLPQDISEKSTSENIINTIAKEYNEKDYEIVSKELQKSFNKVGSQFYDTLHGVFGDDIGTIFDIYLTRYGVDGSYNLPNKIIFNINNKKGAKVLYHEIIHLMIEFFTKKYDIKQFEKERVVDLILHSPNFAFLNYDYWQKSYHSTEKYVDEIFENYFFKDMDLCFKKIKEAHSAIEMSKASTKDVNGILDVQATVWPLLYANKKVNISEKDVLESMNPKSAESKTLWEKVIRESKDIAGDSLTLVAKDKDSIVGFGYAVKDGGFGEIRSIYILPQYQNVGVGSMLLSKMIVWLGRETDITLSVVEYAEKTISFYKKFGFEITEKTSYQELSGGKKIPEIEMRLFKL